MPFDPPPVRVEELSRRVTPDFGNTQPTTTDEDAAKLKGLVEYSKQRLRERETVRKGQEAYFQLRSHWSWFLGLFLFFSLVFQFLVTAMIGLQIFDFTNYQTILHAIVIENFLQIVGMAYIIVRFLFPNENEAPLPTPRQHPPSEFEGMDE